MMNRQKIVEEIFQSYMASRTNPDLLSQYHFGYFVGFFLLNSKYNSAAPHFAQTIWNDYLSLPLRYKRSCPDFNLYPLTILKNSNKSETKEIAKSYVSQIEPATSNELSKRSATDFFYLNYFVKGQLSNKVPIIMGDSGCLFDTYINDCGVPDFVYHCRNLEIIANMKYFKDGAISDERIVAALEFIFANKSHSPSFSYFGRSTFSIYGDASLLLAVHIINQIFENEQLIKYEIELKNHIYKTYDLKCSLSTVNPSGLSYDSYMHNIVYEMFLRFNLAAIEEEVYPSRSVKRRLNLRPNATNRIFRHVYSKNGVLLVQNLKGYPKNQFSRFDTRYTPLSFPTISVTDDTTVDSIIPFKTQNFWTKLFSVFKRNEYPITTVGNYHPLVSGMVPGVKVNGKAYYPSAYMYCEMNKHFYELSYLKKEYGFVRGKPTITYKEVEYNSLLKVAIDQNQYIYTLQNNPGNFVFWTRTPVRKSIQHQALETDLAEQLLQQGFKVRQLLMVESATSQQLLREWVCTQKQNYFRIEY